MKGFYIEITNNLLDPKHYKNMGESVWLYMWLLDRITSINENGIGKVLNNSEITYEIINQELPMSRRTYSRYVARLKEHGYIRTIKVQNGLLITVTKAKKSFGRSATYGASKNNRADAPKMAQQMRQKRPSGIAKNGATIYRDLNIDNKHTTSNPPPKAAEARVIVDFYNRTFQREILYTDGRIKKIILRLKTFRADQIKQAITCAQKDQFFNGGGSRGWVGDLDYLVRSDENLEKYINLSAPKEKSWF